MVVDDEAGCRESLRFLLRDRYDVVCSEGVDDAMHYLDVASRPPDAVLLDIRMPRKSGFEGLREIRERDPHVCVVVLTGHGSVESANEAMRLGADGFVRKPFDSSSMRRTVEHCVAATRAARQRAAVRRLREHTAPDAGS